MSSGNSTHSSVRPKQNSPGWMTNASTGETTILIGAEREGLLEDVVAASDRVVHIPIAGDSLNAAMAATVALYELTRMPPA